MTTKKPRTTRATPSAPTTIKPEPMQFAFLDPVEEHNTKSYGLWDLVPWRVIYTAAELRAGDFLKSIERTFRARGETYKLVLRPARISVGGKETEHYPGEREHLVELAIRRIAVRERSLTLDTNELVKLTIGFYDIFKELQTSGHPFAYQQIEEALRILHGSNFEISRVDVDVDGDAFEQVIFSPIFPQMKMKKNLAREKDNASTVTIQVNALLAQAIRDLDFHDINYKTLMDLKSVPRWFYTKMLHAITFRELEDPTSFTITAHEIRDTCGLNYARERQMFSVITAHLDSLVEANVISGYTEEDIVEVRGRARKKVNVRYTLRPTDALHAQAAKSRQGVGFNLDTFRVVSGGKAPKEGWAREDGGQTKASTTIQARRTSPDRMQESLPFLELVKGD